MPKRVLCCSLKMRALLVLLLAVVPPFVALYSIVGDWRRHEIHEAEATVLRLARHAGAAHDRLLEGAAQVLEALSRGPALPPFEPTPQILALRHPATRPGWESPRIIRLGGANAARLRPAQLASAGGIDQHPVLRRAVERRAIAVGDYEFGRNAGGASITVAYPRVDSAGRVSHVLVAELDAGWLRGWVTEVDCPEGTTVTIIDEHGTVLMHEPASHPPSGHVDEGIARTLAGRHDVTLHAATPDGMRRVFGVRRLRTDSGALNIVIGTPRADAVAYVDDVVASGVTGFGLALLVAGFVAVAGSQWSVVRPLRLLQNAAGRLRRGDLSARTGLRSAPAEVEQLARAFDEMAAALEAKEADIRLQTERLAAQERRFRALIEHAADGIVLADANAVVSYASPSARQILGYAPEELVGRPALDLVHPDDRPAANDRLARLVGDPQQVVTAVSRFRHQDGTWRWLESAATNLLADPAVGAIVANYRDVTVRLEAEEALRRAHDDLEKRVVIRTTQLSQANASLQNEIQERIHVEETLRKLSRVIEQTSDSVFLTDCQGTIEYVNPAFEQVTGYGGEEAIGATPRLFASGRHDRQFYEGLWRTILAGRVFRSVIVNRAKDGREYYEDLTITPLRDAEGAITHFVSTGRDITRNRRAEEALRRMNEQFEHEATRIAGALHDEAGQFLTWAHVTLADVARELPAPTRERLHDVRRHLDEVEEQLRQLSHELHPRVLDDLGFVGALRYLAEGVTRRNGIDVTVKVPADWRRCPLTERTLYRFVQEGLHNVARHACATSASVVVATDEQNVTCGVCDNGVGFDVATLAARHNHSGLGLPGIQDRLEAVRGVLEIVSSPGKGTTLTAMVPLEN